MSKSNNIWRPLGERFRNVVSQSVSRGSGRLFMAATHPVGHKMNPKTKSVHSDPRLTRNSHSKMFGLTHFFGMILHGWVDKAAGGFELKKGCYLDFDFHFRLIQMKRVPRSHSTLRSRTKKDPQQRVAREKLLFFLALVCLVAFEMFLA